MIKFIDLYNDITGQAWSMFDGEIESSEEFEKTVTTSIQKALNNLWCSYSFPFREKTMTIKTKRGNATYLIPNGNIIRKKIKNSMVFAVKLDNDYLKYEPNYEVLDDVSGKPKYFYVKNDKMYLYPTPDDSYRIDVDYSSIYPARNSKGIPQATLIEEDDYIDIPVKYEQLFLSTLLPLAMTYLIASESDENYMGYKQQYDDAYKLLLIHTKGIDSDKTYGWK